MKTSVTLPLVRQTPGALIYELPDLKSRAISKIYVRKEHMPMIDHAYPGEIVLTIETAEAAPVVAERAPIGFKADQ